MKVLLLSCWWLGLASALNYNFVPFTSQSNCLTMASSNNDNLAAFSIAPCSPTNNYQKWTFGTTSTILIQFKPSHTTTGSHSQCLDVNGGTGNQEAPVTQEDCNPGTKSQYWVQTTATNALGQPVTSGYYWYKNFASGRCLTAESANLNDAYDCSPGALHQLWQIGTDEFPFGSPLKNQVQGCLQIAGGSPYSGALATNTGLLLPGCSATAFSQHFDPLAQTPNTWKLIGSNKCLDGGSGAQAAYQYDCVSTAYNQQWLAARFPNEGTTDYTYQVDLLSGLCLTWSPDNLAQVWLETCAQMNTNQQWKMTWV